MKKYLYLGLMLSLLLLAACTPNSKTPTLDFELTSYEIYIGEEFELVPQIENLDGDDLVQYTISEDGILRKENNKFIALKDGQVTIEASLEGYSDIKVMITVKVIKLHTITYHLDGGMLIDEVDKFKESDLPITLPDPSKEGYKFLGWYLDSSFTNKVTQITNVGDIDLYATWEEEVLPDEEYSITYHLDGGSLSDPPTKFTKGTLPLTLPIPTKDGFIFEGWYRESNFSGSKVTVITTGDLANQTLYAKWEELPVGTYSITYHLNGGNLSNPPTKFTKNDLPLTLPNPTKDGFIFEGWYRESNFSGSKVTVITTEDLADQTLYAKWKQIYLITYNLNGGTLQNAISTFSEDDLPLTLPVPIKENFDFGGWYRQSNFSGPIVSALTKDDLVNQTLYAKWEEAMDKSKVYVGVDVDGKNIGDLVSLNSSVFVVGKNAFATFNEALAVATEKIFVGPGQYSESFTVSKSNLELIGPGKNVEIGLPATELSKYEAVMTGSITLANNLSNFSISGLYFTAGATIKSTGRVENFAFTNNKVMNTNEATSIWTQNSGEVPAFMSLYNPDTDVQKISRGIEISNNYFINVPEYIISLARVENVLISYNEFKEFSRDAIRLDGGYNGAKFTVQYNTFENTTQQGYNGIYLRIYGGDGARLSRHTIEVYHNTFKNIGQNTDYSGAISARNYQEKGAKFDIKYNVFENCYNYIFLRNNALASEHAAYRWIADINHNGFLGLPENYYFNNVSSTDTLETNPALTNFNQNYFEDNNGNAIVDLTPHENKISNVASNENHYQTKTSFETYIIDERNKLPNSIQIKNPIYDLSIYETYQLDVSLLPLAVDQRITYTSSDSSVVLVTTDGLITALKEGIVTITIRSAQCPSIVATLEITIRKMANLDVSYEGNSALAIGQTLDIKYNLQDAPGNDSFQWISSNETIATVDQNGRVKAVGVGNAVITIKGINSKVQNDIGITVYDENSVNPLLKLLIQNNRGNLFTRRIGYYGSSTFENRIYNTANRFFPEPLMPEDLLLPRSNSNHPKIKKSSIEYITVHDTGNSGSGSTARANGNFMLGGSSQVSWHYTVGNDGVYRHMDENEVAWHAGDGGNTPFTKRDTGVKATTERPNVTLSGGYLYFNGVKSNVVAPSGATRINDEGGLLVFIGSNGNYFVGPLWSNGGAVVHKGGNYNAVGIEMAVNHGSDVYFTWQRTAKLVADIMTRNNLTMSQVGFHRHFSNKLCPQTMIRANLQEEFLELVQVAYEIRKNYNDYKITFVSHNQSVMDNNGRIVNPPATTTNVEYTITIQKGSETKSVNLNVLVPGQYSWK